MSKDSVSKNLWAQLWPPPRIFFLIPASRTTPPPPRTPSPRHSSAQARTATAGDEVASLRARRGRRPISLRQEGRGVGVPKEPAASRVAAVEGGKFAQRREGGAGAPAAQARAPPPRCTSCRRPLSPLARRGKKGPLLRPQRRCARSSGWRWGWSVRRRKGRSRPSPRHPRPRHCRR